MRHPRSDGRTRTPQPARLAGVLVASVALLAGVGAARPSEATARPLTPALKAQAAYDRMTPAQRIGQLFMVGTSVKSLDAATRSAVSTYHVGNVVLTGRTTASVASVRALTSSLDRLATPAATGGVPLLVSADQEGGLVQVLKGSGFSTMPSAQVQGTWSDSRLRASARAWGQQMAAAGVDVDLGPVMDVVPRSTAGRSFIAKAQRNFGWTPEVVAAKGAAFAEGMTAAGVATTVKHFPGLGHVAANTDTTASVTDTVTSRTSPDVLGFMAPVHAGAPFVMMSSATYFRIDPAHPAVFSPTVITSLLRGELGFGGVVMSDDLGVARSVTRWTPASRAVQFVDAGGDVVLTVDPRTAPAMVRGVTARAASDPVFRAKVKAAVLRVLTVKATLGRLD